MQISLHKLARTTPAIRQEIATCNEPVRILAQKYGVCENTIRKWRLRSDFNDRSHTAHNLQTTLNAGQEVIVIYLRKHFLLPLDDLLKITREFLHPDISRSALDRCLRRHGVGNLRQLMPQVDKKTRKKFKSYAPGYIHIDVKYLPQMADENKRRYLFVAIDRATRWVFISIMPNKSAASAKAFLSALNKACPIKITRILTDNGKEFTDRLFNCNSRSPTGEHMFDQLCAALDIEHRLTPPRSPQTNGMVERFNGRISDILKTQHFISGEELEQTLYRYVKLYNQHLPQSVLGCKTPVETMKNWYQSNPELFHRKPINRAGCDI